MKIRLVIPECDWPEEDWYSKESDDIGWRIETLKQVIQKSDGIGLVITSHNFFAFYPDYRVDAKKFIEKEIIPSLDEKIENKKPLIIGFDLLTSDVRFNRGKKRTGQKKTKGHNLDIRFNPYDKGIDAVVCYIKVKNNSYVYGTHIWECWQDKKECSQKGIKDQYKKRAFLLKGKTIGLLSCGDIASYCHDAGRLLPNVDMYVDLSHKSLPGDTSQRKIPPKLIEDWNKCRYVLVTQQVKDVSNYLKKKEPPYYPYIFPQNTEHKVKELRINGDREGVIIDINIP